LEHVEKYSIKTHNWTEFYVYIDFLTTHLRDSGRLLLMVISQGIIHMSKAPEIHSGLPRLQQVALRKFYEYTGPEYPFEFVMKLKKALYTPDQHATQIQRAFRKSRGYAEWAWHPDRLKAQGFFDL
jgi:hypothetical protein